jgi:hypothetical protein
MALAKPGFCYFSTPRRLLVSNLNLDRLDVVVVMGQNVRAGEHVLEWKPNTRILIPLADAQAMINYYGVGTIDDRERPDTPEAEAIRCARRAENKRWFSVLLHPCVRGNRAQERWADDLLTHTEKSAWEICRILMGNRPVLVKA